MTWPSVVFFENWMVNDCCRHGEANIKQQTANSQTEGGFAAVRAVSLWLTDSDHVFLRLRLRHLVLLDPHRTELSA